MHGIGKSIRLVFAGLLAIGIMAWQAPDAMAASFMKIEGIQGESSDKDHKDWIEVLAVSWSSGSTARAPSGGRANKPGMGAGTVSVTKQTDKASALIMRYNSTGKAIVKMYIDVGSGRDKERYMTYELTNVMVTSFETGGSGGGVPMETITLNYEKIKQAYRPQKKERKREKY